MATLNTSPLLHLCILQPTCIAASSPWDMLTAIGTVSAVVVSVALGALGWWRSKQDRKELIKVREEAAEREERESEVERRRVAGLVTAWVTDTYSRAPDAECYKRTVKLHLANESNEPMVNATLNVLLGDDPLLIGPLATPTPIVVIPPRRELAWDITTGIQAFENNITPMVTLGFTDADGRRWLRDREGKLQETTGDDVFHYADENPDLAQSQIGVLDPARNPMTTAFYFASALWEDPSDFTLDEFLRCLDPVAEGWKGEWDPERVEELRTLLSKFSNLATFAWYSAPEVAYARLFSDQSLNIASKVGVGAPMDGQFITLVFREHLGWKVFGVGPRFTPDQIYFPKISMEENQ